MHPSYVDLRALLRKSVTTLYADLVTRPTGRAVRVGIEQQLASLSSPCVSVIDFSQVGILDFSCADEIVARLLLQYRRPDRPADTFFFLRGLAEHHREPIECVLDRCGLLLGAQTRAGERWLLGPTEEAVRDLWRALEEMGRGTAAGLARRLRVRDDVAQAGLAQLADQRAAVAGPEWEFLALGALVHAAEPPA
ncbi:MAG: hypothetical protein ACREKI_03900 [Gemmatimonadota bacterium]